MENSRMAKKDTSRRSDVEKYARNERPTVNAGRTGRPTENKEKPPPPPPKKQGGPSGNE